MKLFRRLALGLSLTLSMALAVTGCGNKKEEEKNSLQEKASTIVFQYGDNLVTVGEVYIYSETVKERYEQQYGEAVWQLVLPASQTDATSMVDLTKEAIVNHIVRVKTLVAHAKDYGIALSDKEIDALKEKASEFYSGLTEKDIEDMEITEDLAYTVLYENKIADLVTDKILEREPVEVSDETARMTKFYDMYFDCYSISTTGEIVAYSEEDKKQQYDNAVQACSTLGTAGISENHDAENIEKLADYYQLDQAKEQVMTPEEILETYGEDVYNLLYSMENGEYSTVIESEYGYHVFQMIALTDPKATKERKDAMTAELIQSKTAAKLLVWQNGIDKGFSYPESVNMTLLDKIVN